MNRAVYHYERGVAQGDSASLYVYLQKNFQTNLQRMGMLYLLGQKGYPANIPEGIQHIRQSAAKADFDAPQGAFVYALLLAGEFTSVNVPESILPHDERAARRMLEKSSALGFSHAQQKLGHAYETGTWGCGYDPGLSLHYYSLAAKQGIAFDWSDIDEIGDVDAMMALSKWYLCGGEGFTPNEEKAFLNAQRAANNGLPQAEFAMGKLFPFFFESYF